MKTIVAQYDYERMVSGKLTGEKLKITVKPRHSFGYLQGVTVHINGKKFPSKRNFVYAHNKNNKAILKALIEGGYTENYQWFLHDIQDNQEAKKL